MRATLHIASDVVRSASKGRAMLLVVSSIAAFFALLLSALDLTVVEGSLTAFRLFGGFEDDDVRATLEAQLGTMVNVSVLALGIVAGSGAAPALFSPGRVEGVLALPVSRAELVVGTYLGVLGIAASAGALIASGIAALLWWKVGLVPTVPATGALAAIVSFASVYAVMLLSATLIRSTALGVGLGFSFWLFASLTSAREVLLASIENAVTARFIGALVAPIPPLAHLLTASFAIELYPETRPDILWAAATSAVFSVGTLLTSVWVVYGKDY